MSRYNYEPTGNFTVYEGHEHLYDEVDWYNDENDYDDAHGYNFKVSTKSTLSYAQKQQQLQQERDQALQHAENLNRQISDEEYEQFLISQDRERHRYHLFQQVLDEFTHYVPAMLEARTMFQEHLGIPMSGNLQKLENKRQEMFYKLIESYD
jgi:hypothetical protein